MEIKKKFKKKIKKSRHHFSLVLFFCFFPSIFPSIQFCKFRDGRKHISELSSI